MRRIRIQILQDYCILTNPENGESIECIYPQLEKLLDDLESALMDTSYEEVDDWLDYYDEQED